MCTYSTPLWNFWTRPCSYLFEWPPRVPGRNVQVDALNLGLHPKFDPTSPTLRITWILWSRNHMDLHMLNKKMFVLENLCSSWYYVWQTKCRSSSQITTFEKLLIHASPNPTLFSNWKKPPHLTPYISPNYFRSYRFPTTTFVTKLYVQGLSHRIMGIIGVAYTDHMIQGLPFYAFLHDHEAWIWLMNQSRGLS